MGKAPGRECLEDPERVVGRDKHAHGREGFRITGGEMGTTTKTEPRGEGGVGSEVRVWREERRRRVSGVDCEKEGSIVLY